MRNQVFKKLFSALLALIMVAGLLPASVLAEGWTAADVDSTPAPAETVQPTESAEPTEPAETETPEVTEVPEPTPENPATMDEPAAEPAEGEEPAEPVQEETPVPEDSILLAAETGTANEINYEAKNGDGVRLNDNTFYRIFLLDCGRKYFSVEEIKGIIDLLAENHYTHIELAFGNDGLRFLLDNMDIEANGVKYSSEDVKKCINSGNKSFYNAGNNNELTELEMDGIIAYAKDQGIGVIPLFNAPGHMYTVISAMQDLDISLTKGTDYSVPTNSHESPNYALNPNCVKGVNFIKALMQKYVDYFKGKGCKFFNIGADETGVGSGNYSAYAKLVNSHAAMVQNAGMIAMAFNDGIYNPAYTYYLNGVEFDKNIVISYWTHNSYATAENLAKRDFIINSTHNNWYYILGLNDSSWAGYQTAYNAMQNTKCNSVDSGYTTTHGCTFAVWCDTPSMKYSDNKSKVETLIKRFAEQNPDYFKAAPVPTVSVKAESEANKNVTVDATKDESGATKVTLKNNVAEGESYTLQLGIDNAAEGAVFTWKSDNEKVATVDGNGLVTFVGSSGTVTITATPEAATKDEIAAGYSITFSVAKEGEIAPVTKNITVTIGATFEDKIEGYKYSENDITTQPDGAIATVASVSGEDAQEGKVTYSQTSVEYSVLAGNNTSWTETKYYYKSADNYYPVYAYKKQGGKKTTYYYGYKDGDNPVTQIDSSWNGNSSVSVYEKTGSEPVPAGTTVTIKGVAEGDTTVTIGHVTYNVHVTKEDLTKAKKFYIQLWSTNITIEGDSNGKFATTNTTDTWHRVDGYTGQDIRAKYVTVTADKAYGEKGVLLSELVPESVKRYENNGTYWVKEQTGKSQTDLVLLKGKALTGQNNLQYVWNNDHCNDSSGTEFMYVRYFDGKWEVSPDGTAGSWTEITNCIQNAYTESGYQVIAYYRIRTQVVDEVYTDLDEWATIPHTGQDDGYCLLDFRVKDDTGLVDPTNFPVKNKTMGFACGEGVRHSEADKDGNYYRMLNSIAATAKDGYEIYMVTLTPTSDTHTETLGNKASDATNYQYNGTEKVVWVLNEDELPDEFRNEAKHYTESPSGNASTYKVGGKPDLASVEIYQGQGLLVTYYIRQIKNDASLTVHYREDNGKEEDFYYYNINVDNGIFFKSNIALGNPTKGYLQNGEVKNKENKTEKVTSNLSAMIKVPAQYRFAQFECVRMTRLDENGRVVPDDDTSTNVKEVVLYYTLSYQVTLVLDFGLSLVITPGDVNSTLKNANITKTEIITQPSFATASLEGNNVRYTLTKTISEMDNLTVTYTGENIENDNEVGSVTYTVTIIPATTVYYEDSFAKFYGSDGKQQTVFSKTNEVPAQTPGVWYIDGQEQTANQALEALGTKENVYGYDDAYKDSTMFSMGSARKVTVATNGEYAQAKFTFKGTGFDVISLTNNNSGAITVEVFDKDGKTAKTTAGKDVFYLVNNYYGYTYDKDTGWTASPDTTQNAIYQVPVIKVKDLAYGEYTAVITVDYASFFDKTGDSQYSFWLDAVRVYNPAGNELDTEYGKDSEAKPVYTEVRKALIGQGNFVSNDATNVEGAVFIDGKATGATIEDYTNYGPNHEVYLAQGQAIAFKIVADSEPKTVQLGVKLANGESGTLNIGGDGIKFAAYNDKEAANSLTLGTATDMYYALTGLTWNAGTGEQSDKKVSNLIVLTNSSAKDAANIISITNVKCTFEAAQEAETNTVALAISYDDALMAVSMVNNLLAPEPEPEPEKTFEPERFEASWTKNVMQGRKATLNVKTSEDVEAITVDGQTVSSYRTRTERVGFGRRAKRITYREFTYSMVAQETADFSITAINAEGIESEAITARLTVQKRPSSVRDVWNWFKGWF